MQRRAKKLAPSTDPELHKAEKQAQKALRKYMERAHGIQKQLALDTGIKQPFLSKLARRENQVIALEAAMLIEIATGGELKAEVLCPARASVIEKFMAGRTGTAG